MKKQLIFCFVLTLLFAPFSYSQTPFNVEEYLPANTLMKMEVTNGKDFCENIRSLGMWKMFQTPEWKAFFATIPKQLFQKIEQKKKAFESQFGLNFDSLKKTFSGQLSISLIDLKFSPMGPPMPVALIAMDLGKEKDNFSKFLMDMAKKTGMPIQSTQLHGYTLTEIPAGPVPVYLTFFGSTMLICNDKQFLEIMLDPKKKIQTNLAKDKQYLAVKKQVLAGHCGAFVYVNVKEARALAMEFLGEKAKQVNQMLKMSGIDGIDAVALGTSVRDAQVTESLYVYTPKGRTGILGKSIPSMSIGNSLTKYIPEQLIGFSHASVDVKGIYDLATNLMKMFSPRDFRGFTQMIQEFEKETGIKVADFLASLGTELLFTTSFSGGLIPDFGFSFALEDSKKFQDAFTKILRFVPKKYHYTVQWNGQSFTYFNFSSRREPIPFAPTVSISADRVLVTPFPETTKNLLMVTNGKLPAEAVKRLKGRKYSALEYWNIKDLIVPIYKTIVPLAQSMIPRYKVPVEPALLPSGNLLAKYLTNTVFLAVYDKEGLLWELNTPAGSAPAIVAIGGAGAAFFKMQQERRRRRWRRWKSKPKTSWKRPKKAEKKPMVAKPNLVPIGKSLTGNFVAAEENRTIKANTPLVRKIRLWLSKSRLKVKLHAALPPSTTSYGKFKIEKATDNLGTVLKPNIFKQNSLNKFPGYKLKDIKKGKGYIFDLDFSAPSRKATHFSLKGSFVITAASKVVAITLPKCSELKKGVYTTKKMPGNVVTITTKAKTIKIKLVGAPLKYSSFVFMVGKKELKHYSYWSSGYGKTYTYNFSYKNNIPEDAVAVLKYIDKMETKTVVFDIKKAKLP